MKKDLSIDMPPKLKKLLENFGENLKLARLRRKFSAQMIAERAGISRNTLIAIEQGQGNVSMAAYAKVMFSLNLEQDLGFLAKDDELGRRLQDAGLLVRRRAPKQEKSV
jgi:transcriptional regulator with XRE-family HTH domain